MVEVGFFFYVPCTSHRTKRAKLSPWKLNKGKRMDWKTYADKEPLSWNLPYLSTNEDKNTERTGSTADVQLRRLYFIYNMTRGMESCITVRRQCRTLFKLFFLGKTLQHSTPTVPYHSLCACLLVKLDYEQQEKGGYLVCLFIPST